MEEEEISGRSLLELQAANPQERMPELYNMLMAAPKAAPSTFMKPVSEESLDKAPWPTEKRPRDDKPDGHRSRKYALEDDVIQEPSDKPVKKRRKTKAKDLDNNEVSMENGRSKDSSPTKRWRVKTVVDTHIEIMKALSASTINTAIMPAEVRHMEQKPRFLGSDRLVVLQYQDQLQTLLNEEQEILKHIQSCLHAVATLQNLPEEQARREAEAAAENLLEDYSEFS